MVGEETIRESVLDPAELLLVFRQPAEYGAFSQQSAETARLVGKVRDEKIELVRKAQEGLDSSLILWRRKFPDGLHPGSGQRLCRK